jgi:CheY-like chemotaxis protein
MESRQPSPPLRKTVLVVDSDPQSLRIVDVSLRRAGFDVHASTDGISAAAIIDRVPPPDLVIADAELTGIDGFELCRRTKASTRTGAIPFLFLARPHAAHKMRAFELGADDFLAKPVFVKEVIARVEALLQRHERERLSSRDLPAEHASGSLADLSTIDLLQSIATNGKSGVLHLRSASGVVGEVYFRRGAVVDAEVGRLSGPDAVYRLLSWTGGTFEIEWRNIRRRDAVALPAPALLMEGMRRLDEWTRLTQQLPPLETVFEVDYRLLAERLADIPDEVNAILRLFDGVRTAMQVIDDCGLSDIDALTVIGKLNSEGLIRNVSAKTDGDEDKAGPDLEGWLGHPADAPPAAPAPSPVIAEGEPRLRRASDPSLAPQAPVLRRAPEPIAAPQRNTPTTPIPEWRERMPSDRHDLDGRDDRDARDALLGDDNARSQSLRADEPAVVIPFPSASPPTGRATLVSAIGGPAAAVAGEISNGVATPSASPASPSPSSPTTSSPSSLAQGLAQGVATPRSTDPGLGPLSHAAPPPVAPLSVPLPPPISAPVMAAQPEPAPAPPAAHAPRTREELPAVLPAAPAASAATAQRRDSAGRSAELPFDDSAARWMTEGDEIHTTRRSEALEELGMPSRFRGWALVIGVVIVAGGAVVGVRMLSASHKSEMAVVTSTTPPPPATTTPPPEPVAEANPAPGTPPAPNPAVAANLAPPPSEKVVAAEPAAKAGPAEPAAAVPAPEGAATPSAEFDQLLTTCQSAFSAGKMKDATTACAAAVQANPESPKALALLAHSEFNRSHRKDALSLAEKAIKIDPKLADAYVIIGGVQQDAGRNADAKSAYRKYLELAPKGQYAADLRSILDSL